MSCRNRLLGRPVDAVPLAVVDLETTGLSAEQGDRVCEIAVLRVEPGREPALYTSLVNPGRPIDPFASAVNGISDVDVRDAPPFAALLETVDRLLADAVLVAHNAPFDAGFLTAEYAIARLTPPDVPVIDTLAMARRFFVFRRNRLGALAAELGVVPTHLHRAAGDATTTYQVLLRLLERLRPPRPRPVAELVAASDPAVLLQPRPPARLPGALGLAVDGRRAVAIRYTDAYGNLTQRVVEPLWVNDLYLIAHCRKHNAQRTFRLDRITEARLA